MPTVHCPGAIACQGVDSPVANLSSEGPDLAKCFRYAFTTESSLTCEFDNLLCEEFARFDSDISLLCNPPPSIINGQNPPSPIVYSSRETTCTDPCGGSYTVVAGTFVAFSQAEADALAFQFACTLAAMLCLGPLPTLYTNSAQSCTVLCPNGSTFTYTAPADLFTALSQVEANSNAHAFACDLAQLLCSGLPPVPLGSGGAGEPRTAPTQPLFTNYAQRCSSTCPNGSIYYFTAEGGLFLRESRTAANAVAQSYACNQANVRRVCLSDLQMSICLDDFYGEFLDATGLAAPIVFGLAGGSLPPGITLAGNMLSGEAVIGGTYSFIIRATGADGNYVERAYTQTVAEITPDTLPDGSSGTSYAAVLSITGMSSPVWSVIGALPTGLVLNPATGVISGTPSANGTFGFAITATEGLNSCSKAYSVEITGCVDWDSLLWQMPVNSGDGTTSYTWTPLPAQTGASFVGSCHTPDRQDHPMTVLVVSGVPFNGGDCNCNLHLDVGGIGGFLRITVTRDDLVGPAQFLLDLPSQFFFGAYDFPFVATAGNYNLFVNITMIANDPFHVPTTVNVSGAFSNI